MRKFLILLVVLFITTKVFAQTEQLISAKSLFERLSLGREVNVVIHYSKCKLIIDGEEKQSPDAVGGMKLMPFEYFARMSVRNEKAYVTSSETHLISHRSYGYVLNYVKIRIFEDDTVEIIAQYLDPNSFQVRMDEIFWAVINNGSNDGAVYLYTKMNI